MSTSTPWTFTGTPAGIDTVSEHIYGDSSGYDNRGSASIKPSDPSFTISDTTWIIRLKYDIVAFTGAGAGNSGQFYFGFSDNIAGVLGSRDGLGITSTCGSGQRIMQAIADNAGWGGTNLTTTPSVTTYYAELKRTSATSATLTLYSNPTFTAVVETSTTTIAAGLTGLKYIVFGGWDHASSDIVGLQISEIVIYDNYTVVP